MLTRIDAGGWGLTWAADDSGKLHQVGLGPHGHTAVAEVDVRWYPDAHPTWGDSDPLRKTALRVTHHDGTVTTRLRFDSLDHSERADGHDGEHFVVVCLDEVFDLGVEHHFLTHADSGVLESWVEITNDEPAPVRICDYDSVALNLLAGPAARVTQFGGSGWADEWRWNTHGIAPGVLTLGSLGGIQPHLQSAPFLLLEPGSSSSEPGGSSSESAGSSQPDPSDSDGADAIGLSVQWMGNTRFELDLRPAADPSAPGSLWLRAGANPHGADYVLDPGLTLRTPAVAWTWSSAGRPEVTRRFHEWTRTTVMRDPQRLRPIVVNNWEATGMAFDEARLVELIRTGAELGGEVFLLDDGWFGTTYRRDDDTQGLGDWEPDPSKLPRGLPALVEAAQREGIRFGIWVEPEMVNPRSKLYEAHPEWVIRDRREPREHRQQLALDPLIEDVAAFEADVFDRVLGGTGGISYLKWDANRPVTEPGSTALSPQSQSNLWIDAVVATWALMDEVVARHPDVELMLCASGGGRNDHGTLRRFHEFWLSDNTDPIARVRMQWACSHFFPAAVIAAHVTRWGERPIEFACAVALSCRFGFDIDLTSLTDDEHRVCRRAVAFAKRAAPVVQRGVIEHLVSPVEGVDRSRAAVAYHGTSENRTAGNQTVLFTYQLEAPTTPPPAMRIVGLDRACDYEVTCTDLTRDESVPVGRLAGADLATVGLEWPLTQPCTAMIFELNRV